MSNIEKKKDNDNLRKLRSTLNALTKLSIQKDKVVEEIPEISSLEKYQNNNSQIDIVEDESFLAKIEEVASLQFLGKKKEEICQLLSIDSKTFKEIVLSDEFQNIKKRLAEDKKVYILSQLLDKIDNAMSALSELVETSDEDKTRLNAVALLFEQTHHLLDEQKTGSGGGYADLMRGANIPSGEVEQVNLAQIILRRRKERGL